MRLRVEGDKISVVTADGVQFFTLPIYVVAAFMKQEFEAVTGTETTNFPPRETLKLHLASMKASSFGGNCDNAAYQAFLEHEYKKEMAEIFDAMTPLSKEHANDDKNC